MIIMRVDVAFVGKLYKSDYSYISNYQDVYTKGYLEGIVETQQKLYGRIYYR